MVREGLGEQFMDSETIIQNVEGKKLFEIRQRVLPLGPKSRLYT